MLGKKPRQMPRRGVCHIGHAGQGPAVRGLLTDGVLHTVQGRMQVISKG